MYQIDYTKRYNVRVSGGWVHEYIDVELLVVERGFVIIRDSDGKEHILTGHLGIYIDEV